MGYSTELAQGAREMSRKSPRWATEEAGVLSSLDYWDSSEILTTPMWHE